MELVNVGHIYSVGLDAILSPNKRNDGEQGRYLGTN